MHQELSQLFLHEVQDPRVSGLIIIIVKITPDLRVANIYFSDTTKSEKELNQLEKSLLKVTPFIRRKLGDNLRLRITPELHFYPDKQTESINHVLELLENLNPKSQNI